MKNEESIDAEELGLRSEGSNRFMQLIVENMTSDAIATVIDTMMREGEHRQDAENLKGRLSSGTTIRNGYLKVLKRFVAEAKKTKNVRPLSKTVPSDDSSRDFPKEPEKKFEDSFEAALHSEIKARMPATSSREVSFEKGELDEIERQLKWEMIDRKNRESFAKAGVSEAESLLEKLNAITKPGDFFRILPYVWKMPEPPQFDSSYSASNALIMLPSMTFQYEGRTVTRNCAVNGKTVKVGHPLAFKLPDGSHLIRSTKPDPRLEERWVKALIYTPGALIRYFTQIDDQDAPNLTTYAVVRSRRRITGGVDTMVEGISEAEFRGLETAQNRK